MHSRRTAIALGLLAFLLSTSALAQEKPVPDVVSADAAPAADTGNSDLGDSEGADAAARPYAGNRVQMTAVWRPAKNAWRFAVSFGATGVRDRGARFYTESGYLPAFTLAAGYQLSRPYSVDLEYESLSASRDNTARLQQHLIGVRSTAVLLDRLPLVDPYVTARVGLGFARQVVDADFDELRDRGVGVDAVIAAGVQFGCGSSRRYIGFLDAGYRMSSPIAFDSAQFDGFGEEVDLGDVSTRGPMFRVGFRFELDRN